MSGMSDWLAMTHDQIYEAVQRGPGGGAAMLAEDMWRGVEDIVAAAEARAHSAIAANAAEWDGGGAESARASLSTLNEWVLGAVADAQSTLYSLTEQGRNAGSFRNAVAPPHAYELFEAQSEAQFNPNSREAADRLFRAESMAQDPEVLARGDRAQDLLRDYINQSYTNMGHMSYWSIPPVVTVDTAPIVPAGAGGGGGAGGPGLSGLTPVGLSGGGAPIGGGVAGAPGAGGGSGPIVPGVPGAGGGSGAVPAGYLPGAVPAGGGIPGVPAGFVPGAVPAGGGIPGVPAGFVPGAVPAGGAPIPAATYTGRGGGPVPGAGIAGGGIGGTAGDRGAGAGGARVVLPPGAGGRGIRPVPDARSYGGGSVQPVIPRAPASVPPSPTWRDVVAGGVTGGRPDGGLTGGRPGLGGGVPPTPRGESGPRITPVATPVGETVRGGSAAGTHGLYPPMAGGAGRGQGEERRRAPFLIDDSGVFDVDVACTDPVIGGELPREA